MQKEAAIREPLILGDKSYKDITDDVVGPIQGAAPIGWKIMITISTIIAIYGVGSILYLLGTGIGVWGLNKTVGWAWDITNFVWWVGIGHAGTLISAVLLLFRQKWRMAINRSAEAMTIFAVIMAAIFPGIHMGRIWVSYWVLPLPNQFGSLWVNFNSPLLWDVFAISTYFSVSLVFWYIGLIPDFATIRDRMTKPLAKKIYGVLSFGWSGRGTVLKRCPWSWRASPRHWYSRYTRLYPWTLRHRWYRVGTRPSSRPTSYRVRYSRASRWCRPCS